MKYTVEYNSEEFKNNQSVLTVLDIGDIINSHGIKFSSEFYYRTAGYKLAGSCAVWTDEVYGYRYFLDGSQHGRYSKNKTEILEYWKKLVKKD